MSTVSKISSKYQVTLPRDVRKRIKARIGDLLVFIEQGDGSYRIQAIPNDLVEALHLAGRGLSRTDFRRVHREFEESWDDVHR